MQCSRYRLSFGTGGLFLQESVRISELYLSLRDWERVRRIVETQNVLQCRTASTSRRRSAEIITRLEKLKDDELNHFVHAHPKTQAYILWIAVCRCYRLIGEFAIEVIKDRYASLKLDITYTDFDLFFERKSLRHRELSEVSRSTRMKLRQVLFKMMREAGIIDEKNKFIQVMASSDPGMALTKDRFLFLPLIDTKSSSELEYVGY